MPFAFVELAYPRAALIEVIIRTFSAAYVQLPRNLNCHRVLMESVNLSICHCLIRTTENGIGLLSSLCISTFIYLMRYCLAGFPCCSVTGKLAPTYLRSVCTLGRLCTDKSIIISSFIRRNNRDDKTHLR